MTTDKLQVRILLEILQQKGVTQFVISPGSRNTPMVIGIARNPQFKTHVVIDERCAAFSALGLSVQKSEPVALVCTSGTAVLNYAPAIAEAYYRGVPLIVITADRQPEVIDQNDSQTLRQNNIYANYIKYSCTLPTDIISQSDRDYTERLINEAVNKAITPEFAPVHINMPLREPLANLQPKDENLNVRIIDATPVKKSMAEDDVQAVAQKISNCPKVMLVASFAEPNSRLNSMLSTLAELPQVVLLTETISNIDVPCAIKTIDRTLTQIPSDCSEMAPRLLITFGGSLVTKMLKTYIRANKPLEHIHLSEGENIVDTFAALTRQIDISAENFFDAVTPLVKPNINATYNSEWHKVADVAAEKKSRYVASVGWSDLKAFSVILPSLPKDCYLQLSNGTPIRYAQLFDNCSVLKSSSNRGVSGIDGSVSTAVGASWATDKQVVLITGDMGFLYDSNGLSIPDCGDLKIIVMKNGGGGIFRFLSGTSSLPELERYFETVTDVNVKLLAEANNYKFFSAKSEDELSGILPQFFASPQRAVLEVVTPRTENDIILRNYFKE